MSIYGEKGEKMGLCDKDLSSICLQTFQYIGTLDVPRPSSRVEIVAAMRRIRVSI